MDIEKTAAQIVTLLLEDEDAEEWPFRASQGTVQLFIHNITSPNHGMVNVIHVGASMANYDRNKPVGSAWEWAVAEKARDMLNEEYRKGKRDFTEEYVTQMVRRAEKLVPYVSGNRPPPRPPPPKPPNAEEKQGALLVQQLQKMAGINEPFDKALRGWRSMSDDERESTRKAASFFGASKAKHRLN